MADLYEKSLDDEFDWKLLDELYGVVSQISNFCFETKKFCVTTEFVVLALIAKFTSAKLDDSLFVIGLAIPIAFWFLDSVAYYYQVSLRGKMESIRTDIKRRNDGSLVMASGVPVIQVSRVNGSICTRVFNAAINHSMWIYALIAMADLAAWKLFTMGIIK